jgi:hypothetical protein
MRIIETVSLAILQRHEMATDSNVTLGGYGLSEHCPLAEFAIHRANLDAGDIDRLFLLGTFAERTHGRSARLKDVLPEFAANPRVDSALRRNVDLRSDWNLEIVIVTAEAQNAPLTVIDGNHRAVAHFLRFGDVGDVPAYLCVHGRVGQWPYIPRLARC